MSEAIRELPDIETLVVHHLQQDDDLRSAGLRQVAGPDPPNSPKYPLAHVQRFGGVAPIAFWLDGGLVEVNLWAAHGTSGLRVLGAKVFVSLQKLVGVHAEGVVTGVEEVGGRAFLRDGADNRPRFRIGVRVFAHPLPRAPQPTITIEEEGVRVARLREPIDISEEGTVITTAGG